MTPRFGTRLSEAQLALMMLTRLPAGRVTGELPQLTRATWAFPLVGFVVGLGMGGIFALAHGLGLPPLAAALLALATSALLTGALHEDGLADVADGFGGGQTVTRKLEIMRDSRIGSYGVLALLLVTGLTASAIAEVGTFLGFLALSAASRAAMLLPMILLPPARTDGLGRSATTTLDAPALTAFALTALLLLVTGTLLPGLLILITALVVTALSRRQIAGQTGDVLGATQKLTECAGWLTLATLG